MNRKLLSLIAAGVLVVSMVGCAPKTETTESAVNETQTEKQEVVVEVPEATETVEEEGTLEINFEGKSLQEIKAFIDENKENATSKEMDEMVVLYDQQLRKEFMPLFEKYLEETYYNAVNNAKDEAYVLHVENIADEKIKAETLALMDAGYGFDMLEGDYYLTINYETIYNAFGEYLSEAQQPYYELKMKEFKEPVFVEEYLNIGLFEAKNRAETLEKYIANNPNSPFRDEEKDWLTWYVNALLRVDPFSDTVNSQTGAVSEDVKTVYNQILESDSKVVKQAIVEMMAILEANDFVVKMDNEKVNNQINDLKGKYYDAVKVLVDEHYPAQ